MADREMFHIKHFYSHSEGLNGIEKDLVVYIVGQSFPIRT